MIYENIVNPLKTYLENSIELSQATPDRFYQANHLLSNNPAPDQRDFYTQGTLGFGSLQLKKRDAVVLIGGGQLALPIITKALEEGKEVFILTARANTVEELVAQTLLATRMQNRNIHIIPMTYKEGQDPAFITHVLESYVTENPHVLLVNTRGMSTLSGNQTYEEVIEQPAIASAQGLADADIKGTKSLVSCSSSASIIHDFHRVNKYAAARRKTDDRVTEIALENEIHGVILCLDLVVGTTPIHDKESSLNHGFSPLNWASLPLQPTIGDPEIASIQPVSERQVAKATLNSALYDRPFDSIAAVGPKQYSQEELYRVIRNLIQAPLRLIGCGTSGAKWIGKHVPVAQLSYGIDLLFHRMNDPEANKPLDHTAFEELVGEELDTLEHIYRGGKPSLMVHSNPISPLLRAVIRTLLTSPVARSELPGVVVDTAKNWIGQKPIS